ncbi:subtilase-type protease inhibitor [Streptomyces pinistramenti]|uniref:subtilase-type protease inhibitor n=1 Tax=Streptomyces pinistramenti TaxID=2884812 RepID=UPI001D060777|nr:subtilase-type protease inhibitor [Streptomyces pinistramenti]MCB5909862.1 subtilase-type protease inhibitor [Streptomyces pinistramenti]
MRYITGGIALGAALVLGALATTAQAATTPATAAAQSARTGGLYAPSALVLTVGQGESRASATVERAVTLTCAPAPGGTHPVARAACGQLRTVAGDFDQVTGAESTRVCTKEWAPVVVTADGVWQGHRVSYAHTFPNSCAMRDGAGAVFEF